MAKNKTPYFLKEIVTGEIHYFDFPVDRRMAMSQVDEDGKPRFQTVGKSKSKFNSQGEQVFPKPKTAREIEEEKKQAIEEDEIEEPVIEEDEEPIVEEEIEEASEELEADEEE